MTLEPIGPGTFFWLLFTMTVPLFALPTPPSVATSLANVPPEAIDAADGVDWTPVPLPCGTADLLLLLTLFLIDDCIPNADGRLDPPLADAEPAEADVLEDV